MFPEFGASSKLLSLLTYGHLARHPQICHASFRRALRYAAFTSILAQLEACRDACTDDPEVNLVWAFFSYYIFVGARAVRRLEHRPPKWCISS